MDIDIDDIYQILLEFQSGVCGHLLVDVMARAPVRSVRLCSEKGTLEWDAMAKAVRFFCADSQQWEVIHEPDRIQEPGYLYGEDPYIEEMRDFVAAFQDIKAWGYTLDEDKAILDVLSAIELSSDRRTQVKIGTL